MSVGVGLDQRMIAGKGVEYVLLWDKTRAWLGVGEERALAEACWGEVKGGRVAMGEYAEVVIAEGCIAALVSGFQASSPRISQG